MVRKTKSIYKEFNFKKILKSEMTSRSDLEFMCDKLGLKNVKISWLKDYDSNYSGPQILNLGNNTIGGTHWVAIDNNFYFDSFGITPPPQLEHLQYTPLHIQNINFGFCGNYCLLWLYYSKMDELDQFYNLFKY